MTIGKSQDHRELFRQNGVTVKYSTQKDVDFLKHVLRKCDKDEIMASNNLKPEEALQKGLDNSLMCMTVHKDNPIGMFGIVPISILGDTACIWFLASDELENIKSTFIRGCREFIIYFLDHYPKLYNYVDDRNRDSIKWLKFCGAKVDKPAPYGANGMPFRYFCFEK